MNTLAALAAAAAVSIAINVLILALCRVASLSDDWHMQAVREEENDIQF